MRKQLEKLLHGWMTQDDRMTTRRGHPLRTVILSSDISGASKVASPVTSIRQETARDGSAYVAEARKAWMALYSEGNAISSGVMLAGSLKQMLWTSSIALSGANDLTVQAKNRSVVG